MTPQPEAWEAEFDKKFGLAMISDKSGGNYVGAYLLDFIRSLLAKREQEVRKRVQTEQEWENMKLIERVDWLKSKVDALATEQEEGK